MSDPETLEKPADKKGANKPCDDPVEPCPLAMQKFEIVTLDIKVDAPSNELIMNDPAYKCLVTVLVTYKKSDAKNALDSLPDKVDLSFTDPNSNNTEKVDSFNYSSSLHLGKKLDATAVYWHAHGDNSATSSDGYASKVKVTAIESEPDKSIEAKVYFTPSGVGGNDYEIEAKIFKADGTTELICKTSSPFVIWRKVSFDNIYEMQSMTHVSTNATTAIISPVYTLAFVKYTAGTRNELTAAQSVKYIGLWKDSATPQRSWATLQAKVTSETPTVTEIADAQSTGTTPADLSKKVAARLAINTKAQTWADRIDSAFFTDMRKWLSDTALPDNSLVAIECYHPKFSQSGGDYTTNEWSLGGTSVPTWLRVDAFQKSGGGHYYTNLDPDGLWINWGGLSHGSGRVSVPSGNSVATTKQVVRHEAGHATKYFFKRDVFGPSLDHSASNAGIMYYTTSGGTTFTTREKKILRGIIP